MSSQTKIVRSPRSRPAFTLVELLVVIGIIALLISILLPSLARARRAAQSAKCLSNLHQIGILMSMYSVSNKSSLPYGYWSGVFPISAAGSGYNGAKASDWTTLLAAQLSGKLYASEYANTQQSTSTSQSAGGRGIFVCPTATQETTYPNILTDYSCTPRLMPEVGQQDGDPRDGGWGANPTTYWKVWKLSAIRRSQEVALIFDAAQQPSGPSGQFPGSFSANPVARYLDAGRQWGDNFLTTNYSLSGAQPWLTGDASIDLTPISHSDADFNADTGGNNGGLRFRHGNNNVCNVLYADGHATPSQLNVIPGQAKNSYSCDLKRRNISVDYKPCYETDHS